MKAPEVRHERSEYPSLGTAWLRFSRSRAKLAIRWGAVLFCVLFWLGVLFLYAR